MTNASTKLISFGSGSNTYTFPMVQRDYNDNFPNLVPRTVRLPGLDGGFDDLGDDPAPANVGNISAGFTLKAQSRGEMSALRDAVRAMAAWGKQKLIMQPGDLPRRFCYARINNISMPENRDKNTDLHQPVTLTFQVDDPFWYGNGTELPLWGVVRWGEFYWGGAPGDNIAGTSTDLTITNNGTMPTFPRIVVTTGVGQSMTTLTVRRLIDGTTVDEFVYAATISASKTFEVNCRSMSVKLDGANAYSSSFTFKRASFFRLEPGANAIRVILNSGGAGKIKFNFYERYK